MQDEREDVQACILVGADGYQSRIRAQLRDDPPPVFAQRVMWRARLPRPPGTLFNDTACGRPPTIEFTSLFTARLGYDGSNAGGNLLGE
jgi:hypothetical protein